MSKYDRLLEKADWYVHLELARRITEVDLEKEYNLIFKKTKELATIEPLIKTITINDRVPDIHTTNSFKTVVMMHELEHVDGTYYILRMLSPSKSARNATSTRKCMPSFRVMLERARLGQS
jgi:hypothetical protein